MSLFLSGEHVYSHFIFQDAVKACVIKGPSCWDHHQRLNNCKDSPERPLWVEQTSQTPPIVTEPFDSFPSICCSVPVLLSTLWSEGFQSNLSFSAIISTNGASWLYHAKFKIKKVSDCLMVHHHKFSIKHCISPPLNYRYKLEIREWNTTIFSPNAIVPTARLKARHRDKKSWYLGIDSPELVQVTLLARG